MSAPRPGGPALAAARRTLDLVARAALWLAAIGLVAMTAAVGWQVFGRYVLNDTPSWSEPLSLQLVSWMVLLGAAVGVREGFHLGLDIFRHVAPAVVVRAMDVIAMTVVTGFGGAMSWYGLGLAIGTWDATIPVLGLPGGVDFLPLVVGGLLIAVFALERLLDLATGAGPG